MSHWSPSPNFRPRSLRNLASAFALFAALSWPSRARADVSSWASASSGPVWLDQGSTGSGTDRGFELIPALNLQTGMGSSPTAPFVFGGLLNLQTLFGNGSDLGLLARSATRGFVLGTWGAALDLGGYLRFWGVNSQGALASVVFGAPWGITLSANGGLGTNEARQFGVLVGVDFARLTVYRSTGHDWFPNPYPGYRASK